MDEAGRALAHVARGVLQRVPHIISRCSQASHGPVGRWQAIAADQVDERSWRFADDRREVRCILDRRSERTLFGWIVGATLTGVLSPIEHSIVAEAVKQVLVGTPDAHAEELDQRSPPLEHAWGCELTLCAHGSEHGATLRLLTAFESESAPAPSRRPEVGEISLQLRATIPGIACRLNEITRWRCGSLLRLQRPEHDLTVALFAGARRLAAAQLGVVGGRRALRLTSVGTGERR